MKKLLNTTALLALLALVLLLAWALAGSTHATHQVAIAASRSSWAATMLTIMLAVVSLVGFSVIIWLLVKLRRLEARAENYLARAQNTSPSAPGQWAAGPNAQWGRTGAPVPGGGEWQQSIQQLVSLQMLRALRGLGEGQGNTPQPPAREELLPAGYFGADAEENYWYD